MPSAVWADEPKAKAVVVPFELLKSRHIAVPMKINGKGPYRMILDTGAPFTIVNTRAAKDSGMVARDAAPPLLSMFGSRGALKVKSLELGGARVENTSAAVMDHPTVEAMAKLLGPIDGLIGFPFFARYKMTIDYQASQLTLVPSGYQPPETMEAMLATMKGLMEEQSVRVLAPAGQWGFVPHKAEGDEAAGVSVQSVYPGSAAAAAGLKLGDRLLSLDGRWTDSIADTYRAAGFVKAGTAAQVVVRRDGKVVSLTITPRAGL